VLDGLVKIASVSLEGKSMSFVGVPTAGGFGEGSLLKSDRAVAPGERGKPVVAGFRKGGRERIEGLYDDAIVTDSLGPG
jgi:hypothetical protein